MKWGIVSFKPIHNTILAIILFIFVLPLLAACAFAPVDRPVINDNAGSQQRFVNLSPDQAFEVAELAAKSMGYEILTLNKAKGYLKTSAKSIPVQGNADCGAWHGVPVHGTMATVLLVKVVDLKGNQSSVSVLGFYAVKFQGRNLYGMVTREETYRCASLGSLENTYLEVFTRLAKNWSPKKDTIAKTSEEKQKDQKVQDDKSPAASAATNEPTPTASAQTTGTAGPPPEPTSSPQLKKLEMLKSLGLLTEQEFQQEKAKLGLNGK